MMHICIVTPLPYYPAEKVKVLKYYWHVCGFSYYYFYLSLYMCKIVESFDMFQLKFKCSYIQMLKHAFHWPHITLIGSH